MSEDKLQMGPIYQLSQEEEKILMEYLEKSSGRKRFGHLVALLAVWYILYPNVMEKDLDYVSISGT
jgi:hypothetical protein